MALIAGTASAAMNLENLRKDTDAANKYTYSAGAPTLWLIPMRFLARSREVVSCLSGEPCKESLNGSRVFSSPCDFKTVRTRTKKIFTIIQRMLGDLFSINYSGATVIWAFDRIHLADFDSRVCGSGQHEETICCSLPGLHVHPQRVC
jgi:hypothetical protein